MVSRSSIRRVGALSAVPAAAILAIGLWTIPASADAAKPTPQPTKTIAVPTEEPVDPNPQPTGKATISVESQRPQPTFRPTRPPVQPTAEAQQPADNAPQAQDAGKTTSEIVVKTTDPFGDGKGAEKVKEPDYSSLRQSEALGPAPQPKPQPTYNVQWVDPSRMSTGELQSNLIGAAAMKNVSLEGVRGADKWIGVWGSAGIALMSALGMIAIAAAPRP